MAKGWTIRWNYMGHELERIGKRVRGRPWRNGTAQACTGERREAGGEESGACLRAAAGPRSLGRVRGVYGGIQAERIVFTADLT